MNQILLRRFCTGLGIALAGCAALHTQAWADGPEIPVAPPVPEFTIKPVTTRPCLLIDSAGVPAFRHATMRFPMPASRANAAWTARFKGCFMAMTLTKRNSASSGWQIFASNSMYGPELRSRPPAATAPRSIFTTSSLHSAISAKRIKMNSATSWYAGESLCRRPSFQLPLPSHTKK